MSLHNKGLNFQAMFYFSDTPSSKLSLSLSPVKQVSKTKTNAILPCIANAAPSDVRYSWFKDGARLRQSSKIVKIFDGVLMLKNLGQNDKGEYKCTAMTTNETVSATMGLSVIGL